MSLDVLVPVLGRPHRVAPLLASIESTTPDARVLFLADPDDTDELAALAAADATVICGGGTYAEKIQRGVDNTEAPLVFTAADDLEFMPGWFEAACAYLTNEIQVVGVNDLRPRNRVHATHFLMTREYAELPCIDGEPGPFFWGYHHWYIDDEFIGTAQHRRAYTYADNSHVKHLHHIDGLAPDDETYRKGRANWKADQRLFHRRRRLWM